MPFIQRSIEVGVPAPVAYNQWTQFEAFPEFMHGVESVEQHDDRHLHWRVRIGGTHREWEAEITEQIPDKRIAWRSTEGFVNAGVLTFHHVTHDRCRVALQLAYDTRDWKENAAHLLGLIDREITNCLHGFKQFIEERGAPTGAWRATLPRAGEAHRLTGTPPDVPPLK
jgi:uncharacterized membrane protein